eukprot:COSAG02_NODE_2059_length_9974_cov_6.226532_6_plen_77_part_00
MLVFISHTALQPAYTRLPMNAATERLPVKGIRPCAKRRLSSTMVSPARFHVKCSRERAYRAVTSNTSSTDTSKSTG